MSKYVIEFINPSPFGTVEIRANEIPIGTLYLAAIRGNLNSIKLDYALPVDLIGELNILLEKMFPPAPMDKELQVPCPIHKSIVDRNNDKKHLTQTEIDKLIETLESK